MLTFNTFNLYQLKCTCSLVCSMHSMIFSSTIFLTLMQALKSIASTELKQHNLQMCFTGSALLTALTVTFDGLIKLLCFL